MKKKAGSLVWLTVPILLAVGCSTSSRDSSVSYSPALQESASPTSDRSSARVYSTTTPETTISETPVPKGASSQDWQLAQEIRGLLSSDEKLGNAPMAA